MQLKQLVNQDTVFNIKSTLCPLKFYSFMKTEDSDQLDSDESSWPESSLFLSTQLLHIDNTVKPVSKATLKNTKIGFQDQLSLNAG